jgi:hypothetical protein
MYPTPRQTTVPVVAAAVTRPCQVHKVAGSLSSRRCVEVKDTARSPRGLHEVEVGNGRRTNRPLALVPLHNDVALCP